MHSKSGFPKGYPRLYPVVYLKNVIHKLNVKYRLKLKSASNALADEIIVPDNSAQIKVSSVCTLFNGNQKSEYDNRHVKTLRK